MVLPCAAASAPLARGSTMPPGTSRMPASASSFWIIRSDTS
jgi:hypothetical protein